MIERPMIERPLPRRADRGLVAVQFLKGEEAMAKSAGYKLATYQASGGPRAGLVVDDKVFDAAALTRKPAYASVLDILADWRAADAALRKAAASVGKGAGKHTAKAKSRPLAKTKLLAPVRFPSAIYCAGSNYADHANEMAARAIADPGTRVKISGYCEQMDWELELTAVIGRTAKDVAQDKALGYVAGYTIANDLSARDRGKRANLPDASPFKWDWTKHK